MPTVQSGGRGTISLLDDAIVQEMIAGVAQLEPSSGPFTTVMNQLKKVMESDTAEPQHMEDELLPNVDLCIGAHTSDDTTIAVDNPLFYLVGDILHVPRTGENMLVTTAAGTSPVTVTRGMGSMAAALVDDEPIWILGGAQREGDTSRTALNTLETQKTHFMQIVRNSIEGLGTQLATKQHGGDFDEQFEKKLIEHKRQLDRLFKFGTPSKITSSNENLRTLEGINHWIQTNRMAIDGTLGEGEFDAFLEMGFQFGSSEKLLVCSPKVNRSITNFAKNRLRQYMGEETTGLAISEYYSNAGTVLIISDRELKGTTYGGFGYLLDTEYMLIRYLRAASGGSRSEAYSGNLYCKRVENIQANDADLRKDEIFSELCLQLIHERTAAVLTGVEG